MFLFFFFFFYILYNVKNIHKTDMESHEMARRDEEYERLTGPDGREPP